MEVLHAAVEAASLPAADKPTATPLPTRTNNPTATVLLEAAAAVAALTSCPVVVVVSTRLDVAALPA